MAMMTLQGLVQWALPHDCGGDRIGAVGPASGEDGGGVSCNSVTTSTIGVGGDRIAANASRAIAPSRVT